MLFLHLWEKLVRMERRKGRSLWQLISKVAPVVPATLVAFLLLLLQYSGSTDQVLSVVNSECPDILHTADKLYIEASSIGRADSGFKYFASVAARKLPAEPRLGSGLINSIEPVIAGSIRMAMGDPIRGGRLKLYFTDGEEQDITAGDLGLEASQQCLKEALVKGGLWVIFFGFGLQCLVIGCLWYFKKAPDEEITEVSTDHRDVDTSSAKETLQENQDHTELSGVWSFVILGVGIGLVMHGLLSFVSRMGNRKQRGS